MALFVDTGLEQVLADLDLIGTIDVPIALLMFHQYKPVNDKGEIMMKTYDDFEVSYRHTCTVDDIGRYYDFMGMMRRER